MLGPPTSNHTLASLYHGLREGRGYLDTASVFGRWDREFPDTEISDKILEGWRQLRAPILNERWRETHFKFMHHAIYGFDIPPHPNCPERFTACPKCQTHKTNMIHRVWHCEKSSNFCPRILHIILLAALRSVLNRWLDPVVPAMSEVLTQVKHYLTMDKLEVLRNRNVQSKSFFKKWKPFILAFLEMEEIQQLMRPFYFNSHHGICRQTWRTPWEGYEYVRERQNADSYFASG